VISLEIDHVSLGSTIVKVHPDGTGALKKRPQSLGKSCGGWTTKIHLVAADARTAIAFSLSLGQIHDVAEGRKLLGMLEKNKFEGVAVIMDKAYEGIATRLLAFDLGMIPRFNLGIRQGDVQKVQRG